MYSTPDFRKGLRIEVNGEPYIIVDFQHVKPGKGGAFVRTKLKNLLSGNVVDKTFRSGEKVGKPDLEEKEMQFLYQDGEGFHFMDNATYEQLALQEEVIGDSKNFLQENTNVTILFYQGRAINLELPIFVELEVTEAEPGVKGDTASGASKPVTVETGAKIQVPLFINVGDRLKIDTRTGEYIERVKT
ncbi:MAG: elongation factor P [Deltaproteobacteria bacterium]|jgi:elongation factor P|nr:elongation factor P [Deltaproteobacteria bacterium]